MALVATPDPATGSVRIDVDQTTAYDLFTRVVAAAWGSPNLGPAWVNTGGVAANYSVNGSVGIHSQTAVGVNMTSSLPVSMVDFDMSLSTNVSAVPTGNSMNHQFFARLNGTTYVSLHVRRNPSGTVTMQIDYSMNAIVFSSALVVVPGITAGQNFRVRFRGCGQVIQGKAYDLTLAEPAAWNVQLLAPVIFGGTSVAIQETLPVGNTNVLPVTFSYDNFSLNTGQGVRLFRVTPDGADTEVIGSPFLTDPFWPVNFPNQATVWDSEAPFDVDIFYELRSTCTDFVAMTSNTVSLDSDGDGWLRNPINPSLNLRIVMEEFFDECVDQDVVVFSGLDSREYENASGIFDHIQASRPITVSMIRKNYGSTLYLTSFSLDDIDALEDLFGTGQVLLLSLPMRYGWAHRMFGSDYITMFDISQSLIGIDQQVTTRSWTIPFRLSPPPADVIEGSLGGNGIGGGGATYNDLAASALGTTYNSLTASGLTYIQVAQGVGY